MSARFARALGCLVLAGVILTAGCKSGKHFDLNDKVEGDVKIDGVPLVNVRVDFVPDVDEKVQAPLSTGVTDEKGHYTLTCNDKTGAVIGKHNVLVFQGRSAGPAEDDRNPDAAKAPAPGKKNPPVPNVYTMPLKTPLKVEVTPDKHAYDLNLTRTAR